MISVYVPIIACWVALTIAIIIFAVLMRKPNERNNESEG